MSADVEQIAHIAALIGWQAAAQQFAETQTGQSAEYFMEYVSREARADFRLLMPWDESSTVLDIGSGWGNISTAFARSCQRVFALDASRKNLRFVQIRALQEGLPNIVCVQADVASLPLFPASCDVAVMNGVLEWVAWGRSRGNPEVIQAECLARVYDVLKPGGCLYLAIENRFGYKYFLGARDPHTNLRFSSILPRFLARWYSQAVRGIDYREYTYSLSGLKALLQRAGFERVDFFFPIPGYQNYRFLTDYSTPIIEEFVLAHLKAHPKFTRWHYLGGKIASLLKAQKWISSCFSVLAFKVGAS